MKKGDAIDVWIIDHALGQGGMGSVYRCHNRNAPRILAAIKVLDPTLRRSEGAKARFVREAEILYALDHPNVVKVRGVRMDVSTPYLEMEFVDGTDLETKLSSGAFSIPIATTLTMQLVDALAHVHSKGVQHRDIKPSNLIVQGADRIKLVDFGIATESDAAKLTLGNQAFGSVSYVPPEWLSTNVDPTLWDIYAAGLVIGELFTGRQAFPLYPEATLNQEVHRIIREKENMAALELPPRFPDPIRELVREMTRADPKRRLSDLRQAVSILNGAPEPQARPVQIVVAAPPEPASHTMLPEDEPAPSTPPASTVNTDPPLPRTPTVPNLGKTLVPRDASSIPGLKIPTRPVEARRSNTHGPVKPVTIRPPEARPPLSPPVQRIQRWRPSLPGSSEPTNGDPSYSSARSRTATWLEVRWESAERFRHTCGTQLINYVLVLPRAGGSPPTEGAIRALLSHGNVHIDCPATVQVATVSAVTYRLELDHRQLETLHRWLAVPPRISSDPRRDLARDDSLPPGGGTR
jgi:serine/threonine protein kinase